MKMRRGLMPSKAEWCKRVIKLSLLPKSISIRLAVEVAQGKSSPTTLCDLWLNSEMEKQKLILENNRLKERIKELEDAAIEYTEQDKLRMLELMQYWSNSWYPRACSDIYDACVGFVRSIGADDRETREDVVELSERMFALLNPEQRRRLKRAYDVITKGDSSVLIRMRIAREEYLLSRTDISDEQKRWISAELEENLRYLRGY